ncbi:hypothetical protein BH11MYX3_BH11MYX3_25660 [soil metagenome]
MRLAPLVSFPLALVTSLAVARAAPPVIGGTKAKLHAWPDVVAVLGPGGSCSGTLIAPDVVLTAGHCIEIDPKTVVVDSIDYNEPFVGDTIDVKWARAYPDWEHRYDVGVLLLEHVARPKPRAIATACLANEQLAAKHPVQVVGFGLTSPSGTDDNTALHQAMLPILDATCGEDRSCEPSVIPNGEFTAGGRGTDSCFGDSGGPAMLETKHGPVLVGVVSRGLSLPGIPCGNGGVYVRADKVVAWLRSVTGRVFDRAACDGNGDDPGNAETAEDGEGGCSGGSGGAGLLVGAGLIAGVWRRRRGATGGNGVRPDSCDRLVCAQARPPEVAATDRTTGTAAITSEGIRVVCDRGARGGDRSS